MILDPFQKQAIQYINEGYSVIVSAPTGAGKTVIAEHVIENCLSRGEKVIYTAPIKALSNQKFRDFQQKARDLVGILTGDVTLQTNAPVLIMTTEIFRNKILDQGKSLRDFSWVIFDEIHYLDDVERGTVWEESLIFLPEHMRFLGLSATVPNIGEMAQWLHSIHQKPIQVIREDKRPVPLHIAYQCQGDFYEDFSRLVKQGFRVPGMQARHDFKIPRGLTLKPNKPFELIKHLQDNRLLPCIYFVFNRRRTEELAQDIAGMNFLDYKEQEEISALFRLLCDRYDLNTEESAQRILPFIKRGVAYHHAGMLPTLKEVVEQLFTSRLLKVIFTTETFALGINMPARTVIFDELRKFYGEGFDFLKTRDFYQMAGRAGRRSIDTEGFVFCRINPHFISPMQLKRIIESPPEKVCSQFNTSYATLLNLYQTYGERLYDVYPRSFHHFQVRPFLRKKALETLKAKVRMLKSLGYIQDEHLTVKGEFASKIYGYELILAELFESGVLEKMTNVELAVLCLAVVYEPRKGTEKPLLSKQMQTLEAMTRKTKKMIHKAERRFGIGTLSKRCFYHLAPAMELWLRGKSFEHVLSSINVDEGEIVRSFRMAGQVLRELLETPVSEELKARLIHLIALINRGVIDSEKQLRS